MYKIFDTHAHYDDEQFDIDRDELLNSMVAAGIEHVVNMGASMRGCKDTLSLVEKYPFLYGAIGIHPDEVGELTEEDYKWLESNCTAEKIVAIGEIGLDYYWDTVDHATQKEWFVRQMNLAREKKLPIVVHSRDAAADTYDIMKAEHAGDIGGVVHCYSYTKEMARQFMEMDFYFGFGGVLTFSNAKKAKEAAEYIPMNRIVIETDAPYLSPVPNRGKRNSSLNLPYVIKTLAEIKGLSEEEICNQTYENALRLYRIQK